MRSETFVTGRELAMVTVCLRAIAFFTLYNGKGESRVRDTYKKGEIKIK